MTTVFVFFKPPFLKPSILDNRPPRPSLLRVGGGGGGASGGAGTEVEMLDLVDLLVDFLVDFLVEVDDEAEAGVAGAAFFCSGFFSSCLEIEDS